MSVPYQWRMQNHRRVQYLRHLESSTPKTQHVLSNAAISIHRCNWPMIRSCLCALFFFVLIQRTRLAWVRAYTDKPPTGNQSLGSLALTLPASLAITMHGTCKLAMGRARWISHRIQVAEVEARMEFWRAKFWRAKCCRQSCYRLSELIELAQQPRLIQVFSRRQLTFLYLSFWAVPSEFLPISPMLTWLRSDHCRYTQRLRQGRNTPFFQSESIDTVTFPDDTRFCTSKSRTRSRGRNWSRTSRPSQNGSMKKRKQSGSQGPSWQLRSKMLLRAACLTMFDSFRIFGQSTFFNRVQYHVCNDIGFRLMLTHQTSGGHLYLLFEPLCDICLSLIKSGHSIHISEGQDTPLACSFAWTIVSAEPENLFWNAHITRIHVCVWNPLICVSDAIFLTHGSKVRYQIRGQEKLFEGETLEGVNHSPLHYWWSDACNIRRRDTDINTHSRVSAFPSRNPLEIGRLNFSEFGISKPGNLLPSMGSTRNLGEKLYSLDSWIGSWRYTAARCWRVRVRPTWSARSLW